MGDGDRNVRRIHYLDLHSDIDLYDVLGGPTMIAKMFYVDKKGKKIFQRNNVYRIMWMDDDGNVHMVCDELGRTYDETL